MEFVIDPGKWSGYGYWYKGCGDAIGQMVVRAYGEKDLFYEEEILALAETLPWITRALIQDMGQSIRYPRWNTRTEVWLRKTLAKHGHTLQIVALEQTWAR